MMENKYVVEYNNHTKKDFEDVWKIESEYLEPSTISTVEQVMEWDKKNNDIHIFVKDKQLNKIVGEITLLPISQEQFQNFILNKLEDTELNAENLLVYEENKSYYLLFSAIAIDKNYRDDKLVLSYLLNGMYIKINTLLKKNIKFENMCAEGQTKDGQKFIENFLNLNEKFITKDGYKLYSFNSKDEMYKWIDRFPLYIEKYNSTIK
jgi:hypothetical protein